MFAPSTSRPPYYPSYDPPSAPALEALLLHSAFIPAHGMGASNESWKIAHNVYMNETKEKEMGANEIQKTTQALEEMKKIMNKTTKHLKKEQQEKQSTKGVVEPSLSSVSDPSTLVYIDPYAYSHYMERQNSIIFTLFTFPSERWANLKNTPFMRYLYQNMFCLDIGRLDEEWFEVGMLFLERMTNMHTLLLHDGFHIAAANDKSGRYKTKSRGNSVPVRSPTANAHPSTSPHKTGPNIALKRFPDEKKVIENLEINLPTFLQRNSHTLIHLELHGLTLTNWEEIIPLIKRCHNLQRLYLRHCNIGDKHFSELSIILKNHLNSLSAIQLSNIGLTSLSASLICSLIKIQSEKRNTIHWQNYLRQESAPVPSPSILLPDNLSSQGLISLDLSGNKLSDKGVSLICDTLSRDTWIKAIDVSNNAFGEEGLRAIISMLEENKSLLWIQIQGKREQNINLNADVTTGPIQRDARGRRIIPTEGSSSKLLQQFDPHFQKRSKRLLLLFHQQNIEITKYITGREPLSLTDEINSPRSPSSKRFPVPGAAQVFDRFFKPQHPAPTDSYDSPDDSVNNNRPASAITASTSQKKLKKRKEPLLSPMIHGLAAKREQEAALEAELAKSSLDGSPKRRRSPTNKPKPSVITSPRHQTTAAFNFLFPHLNLVCAPEKLMHPDISLRGKPPRSDNSWSTPHDANESFQRRAAAKSPTGARDEVSPTRFTSPQDFRPCLRETCVASTADYIATEKAAYKKKLRLEEEKKGLQQIREVAGGAGVIKTPEEQAEEAKENLDTPSPSAAAAGGDSTDVAKSFTPLTGLVRRVETQLTQLGAQVAADQTAVVRNLQEEHQRLAKGMDRLEQRQREGEKRATTSIQLEHPQPPGPRVPSIAESTGFDIHTFSQAISTATAASAAQGHAQDPQLLVYLEQQFQRLHAYMDLLETSSIPDAPIDQPPPQQQPHSHRSHQSDAETQIPSPSNDEQKHAPTVTNVPPHPLKHVTVERVEQSITPPLTTATTHSQPIPSSSDAVASHPSLSLSQVDVADEIEDETEIQDFSAAISERVSDMYGLQEEE